MLRHHLSLFLLEFEIQIPDLRRKQGIPDPDHEAWDVLPAKRLTTFPRRKMAAICLLLEKTNHSNALVNFCPLNDSIIKLLILFIFDCITVPAGWIRMVRQMLGTRRIQQPSTHRLSALDGWLRYFRRQP